ncbi:hypothetical protein EON63_16825 [archaeon]|nr:MAG: hypothetical protein EON63_16825 [archaeon]
MSPTSLHLTLAQLRRGKSLDLKECLKMVCVCMVWCVLILMCLFNVCVCVAFISCTSSSIPILIYP